MDLKSEILFPYQLEGALWLSKKQWALLGDEMGLGKSAQVIRACDLLGLKNILVLTPAIGRENWLREFEKFSKQERLARVLRRASKEDVGPGITICSYDLELMNYLITFPQKYEVLVLDEVHFLKSTEAKRTHAVFGKNGLARAVDRIWGLSGTPAPNHPGELWPLLYTFGATSLKYDDFIRKFCEQRETSFGFQITGAKTEKISELRGILQPIMLRRRKENVLKDLPDIIFGDVVVEAGEVDLQTDFVEYLIPKDRELELDLLLAREQMVAERIVRPGSFGKPYEPGYDAAMALAAAAKSVSTLRRYNGLQKVEGVAELVSEELDSGAYGKIVIFAIHRGVIEGLRQKLKRFNPGTIYGGSDPKTREINIYNFNNHPDYQILIGNIQACGTNINLTGAHQVIFAEQDWVPGNNAQAAARCHRIGQTKPVSVRFVGIANSIDERISQILKKKTQELSELFD